MKFSADIVRSEVAGLYGRSIFIILLLLLNLQVDFHNGCINLSFQLVKNGSFFCLSFPTLAVKYIDESILTRVR